MRLFIILTISFLLTGSVAFAQSSATVNVTTSGSGRDVDIHAGQSNNAVHVQVSQGPDGATVNVHISSIFERIKDMFGKKESAEADISAHTGTTTSVRVSIFGSILHGLRALF